jgi:hypothetical protein
MAKTPNDKTDTITIASTKVFNIALPYSSVGVWLNLGRNFFQDTP